MPLCIYNPNFNFIVALSSIYLFLSSSSTPFSLFLLVFHAGLSLSVLLLQPKASVLGLQEAAGFSVLSGIPKLWLYFQK